MHNDTVETLIGAAVIVIAVLFVIFVYRTTGTTVGGYEIKANLSRVDGISVGTDVRMSGLKIGTVSAMSLDERNYLVTLNMDIHSGIKIPDDSSLVVTQMGLLGSSYVSISPGGSDKMLPPGGIIRNTQGSIDMMGLISKFVNGSPGGGGGTETPKP